jgi:SAM-dependent methyltransferase
MMSDRGPIDFDELYDPEEYLFFLEETLRLENTPRQCDFVERALGIGAPSRILDLGCGHGRHSLELARRGHAVLGLDRVAGFLALARAAAEREGLNAQFERADICRFEVDQPFDHAICLFDAFGFGDDAEQESMLRCTFAALRPAGRLLLDLRSREWMIRLAPAAVLDKGDGEMMIDRHHFDLRTGRFTDRRTTIWRGRRRDVEFSVRL